MKMTFLEKRV